MCTERARQNLASANSPPRTLYPVPSHKSLSAEANEKLRAKLRTYIADECDSEGRIAAEKLGVTGATISDFLSKKRGAGPKLLAGFAKVRPEWVAQALGMPAGVVSGAGRTWTCNEAIRRMVEDNEGTAAALEALADEYLTSDSRGADVSAAEWRERLLQLQQRKRRPDKTSKVVAVEDDD